jgi:hypothetical protein
MWRKEEGVLWWRHEAPVSAHYSAQRGLAVAGREHELTTRLQGPAHKLYYSIRFHQMLDYVEHDYSIEWRTAIDIFFRQRSLLDVEATGATEANGAITHFDSMYFEARICLGKKEAVRASQFEQSPAATAIAMEVL